MIHIRNAREDEAAVLTEIGIRAWEKAMAPIGQTDMLLDSAREAFANFARSSWLTITVVEQNGAVAGWAAREDFNESLSDFWIDPSHLGQGLGSALLERVEQEIVGHGFEEAMLKTHADNNDAIGFFQKRGYHISWLSIVYSPKLDRDVPTVGLSKRLVSDDDGEGYGPGA